MILAILLVLSIGVVYTISLYQLRYRNISEVLPNNFTEEFDIHSIHINVPFLGEFNETHSTRHDWRHSWYWFIPEYKVEDEKLEILQDLLLDLRVRAYDLRAHPIVFNGRFFGGFYVAQSIPNTAIDIQIFNSDLTKAIVISIFGNHTAYIRMGEREYDGVIFADYRIGFNPMVFRIHEEDQKLVFEILEILDSSILEFIGFEIDRSSGKESILGTHCPPP